MDVRITNIDEYRSAHGDLSLCPCHGPTGTAIIRHQDDEMVYTINLDTLEEEEYTAGCFTSSVFLIPMLVDDVSFLWDPEGSQAILTKQIRAEEKCGFYRLT